MWCVGSPKVHGSQATMWNDTDIGDASAFRMGDFILTLPMLSIHFSQDLMHFSDFISQCSTFLPWIVMETYLEIDKILVN